MSTINKPESYCVWFTHRLKLAVWKALSWLPPPIRMKKHMLRWTKTRGRHRMGDVAYEGL